MFLHGKGAAICRRLQAEAGYSLCQDGCKTPGFPIAMRLGGALQFTYAPGLISIYMQSVSNTRFIRMNQKQGKTTPRYYGNSVGHWKEILWW